MNLYINSIYTVCTLKKGNSIKQWMCTLTPHWQDITIVVYIMYLEGMVLIKKMDLCIYSISTGYTLKIWNNIKQWRRTFTPHPHVIHTLVVYDLSWRYGTASKKWMHTLMHIYRLQHYINYKYLEDMLLNLYLNVYINCTYEDYNITSNGYNIASHFKNMH